MTYRVEVAPAALRRLRKLDPPARWRVQAPIELLAEQPRPSSANHGALACKHWSCGCGCSGPRPGRTGGVYVNVTWCQVRAQGRPMPSRPGRDRVDHCRSVCRLMAWAIAW